MVCPECGKEMKDKSYDYYSIGAWDYDYPDCTYIKFVCNKCRISYEEGEWKVPKKFRGSEKQIKAAEFISKVLYLPLPPPHKKILWKFINCNLQKAIIKTQKNRKYYQDFDDNDDLYDFYPEYF
jgi:hypothetical protein